MTIDRPLLHGGATNHANECAGVLGSDVLGYSTRLSACMLICHKGHTDTIQVYSVTAMTHVKALQAIILASHSSI